MKKKDLLEGKRILIVDDEPDVIEVLEQLLDMCSVEKASTFEEANEKLKSEYFDLAILDIMGVNGYELLDFANQKNVTAVMLTAHALSLEDTEKSFKLGAAFYIPKDEIANIATFLRDVLEAKEKGKSPWWRWLDRMGSYYDKKFGSEWKENMGKDFLKGRWI